MKSLILYISFLFVFFVIPQINYTASEEIPTGKVVYKVIAGHPDLVGMEFLVDFDSHSASGTYQDTRPVKTSGQPDNIEVETHNYRVTEGSFDLKTRILSLKIYSTNRVDRKHSCYSDVRETERKVDEHFVTYTLEATITASLTDDKFNKFVVTPELAPNVSGFVTLSAPSPGRQISEGKWITDCGTTYSSVGKRKSFSVGNWEAVPKDKSNREKTDESSSDSNLEQYTQSMSIEQASRFQEIAKGYLDKIPTGRYQGFTLMKPGQLNNLFGDSERVCGAYQGLVLRYLHSLRFNKDPNLRKLLDGFDYGPIQIYRGAHQAVVLFPKGTDWHETGIVLDPWINQKPELFQMSNWTKQFMFAGTPTGSRGNWITPIKTNQGRYPTTPNNDGAWAYVDEFTQAPIFPSREDMARRRRIVVQSPVKVLAQSNGKKIGIDQNGQFINDFGAEADAYFFPKPDGTYSSSFNLPEGTYIMAMVGIESGEMRVYSSARNKGVIVFNPVQVSQNGQSTLKWNKEDDKPILIDETGNEVAFQVFVDPARKTNNSLLASVIISGVVIGGIIILLLWKRKKIGLGRNY